MWQYVQQAGVIGYILLFLSILSGGVIIERIVWWLRQRGRLNVTDRQKVLAAFRNGNAKDAADIVGSKESPEGRTIRYVVDHLDADSDAPLDIAVDREVKATNRWLMVLEVNGGLAPMLGILGTVTGVIQAFQGMGEGAPNTAVMIAGISLSMTTTAMGLIVAIGSLVPYYLLASRAHRRVVDLADFLQECWMQRGLDGTHDDGDEKKKKHHAPHTPSAPNATSPTATVGPKSIME